MNIRHSMCYTMECFLSMFGASGYISLRIDSYAMLNAFTINWELKINRR